jgi:parvulin-like peptidyl-prolyl isomerase
MTYKVLIGAFLVVTFIDAPAQMASHAPTGQANVEATKISQTVAPQVADKVVAKVNGAVLTDRDLLREMYAIFPYAQQHNGFPQAQEKSIRQGALEMIIFEELIYQEAIRRKIIIAPQVVKTGEADFQRQFGSPDKYQEFLKVEMQGNSELVRQKIRRSMMIEQLLKTEVESKSAVSVAEVRDYYNKHPQRFQQPESLSIQTISVLPPPGVDPSKLTSQQKSEVRKRADEALRQAMGAKDYDSFGMLAEKISEDDFRVNMGLHKTVKPEDLPPDMLKVLETMQSGSVSGLIAVQGAYTIIRLNGRDPARKVSFEQVKSPLQVELQKQKYERLRSDLAKQLRAKAKIEVV